MQPPVEKKDAQTPADQPSSSAEETFSEKELAWLDRLHDLLAHASAYTMAEVRRAGFRSRYWAECTWGPYSADHFFSALLRALAEGSLRLSEKEERILLESVKRLSMRQGYPEEFEAVTEASGEVFSHNVESNPAASFWKRTRYGSGLGHPKPEPRLLVPPMYFAALIDRMIQNGYWRAGSQWADLERLFETATGKPVATADLAAGLSKFKENEGEWARRFGDWLDQMPSVEEIQPKRGRQKRPTRRQPMPSAGGDDGAEC